MKLETRVENAWDDIQVRILDHVNLSHYSRCIVLDVVADRAIAEPLVLDLVDVALGLIKECARGVSRVARSIEGVGVPVGLRGEEIRPILPAEEPESCTLVAEEVSVVVIPRADDLPLSRQVARRDDRVQGRRAVRSR